MIIVLLILLFALKFNYPMAFLDYLIGFVLLAAAASLVISLYVKAALSVRLETDERRLFSGGSTFLKIIIERPRFHTDIIPEVRMEVLQTGEADTRTTVCEYDVNLYEFTDLKAGTVRLSIGKVRIRGLFGLFNMSKNIGFEKIFNVYPKKETVNYRYVSKTYMPGEGETLDAKGDDYTEIYEVRPLQEGDDLKHVHRSLSAKHDEYIIKVGSDSRRVLYNFHLSEGEEFHVMANLLGQLTGLWEKMAKDEGSFINAVWHGRKKEIVYDSQLYELIDRVYGDYLSAQDAGSILPDHSSAKEAADV